MKRLILAALAVAVFGMAAPAAAQTPDPQAQRAQRRAEMQQRRTERLQQLAERRPELKARIDQRLAEGRKLGPVARRMLQKRLKTMRPEMFDRLDLNKDGVLSRDEFAPRQRVRRKV